MSCFVILVFDLFIFFNSVILNLENRSISKYSRLILCCLVLCSGERYLVPHKHCAVSSDSWGKDQILFAIAFSGYSGLSC